MEFSREEYWSGLSFPSPGDLPNPGIEPRSPALQADALSSELSRKHFFSGSLLKIKDVCNLKLEVCFVTEHSVEVLMFNFSRLT